MPIFREFPYGNTHDQNYDWILKVVKDFLTKYTNFDQTVTDALDAIEAAKDGSLEDMQTALTNALTAIATDQATAQSAIAADQATAQAAIASDQSAALLALQTALTAALTSITTEQTNATQIIEQLYNTLPASAQDILGRLNILDNIITGYTPSNAFQWLQGGYVYPEGVTPPTPPTIDTDDPAYDKIVSSLYKTGCAGQRLRISTDGTIHINLICCWFNTPPGGAPGGFSIGQEGLTPTFGDIIFPLNTTAFSIELVSPDGETSISPNDVIGHIDVRWVTDFVGQATIAPKETSNTANVARETRELFFLDGVLYKALEDIAIGDTIVTSGAGANCEETTIDEELQENKESVYDLKNTITTYVRNLVDDFTWMSGKTFDLSTGELKPQSSYNASYNVLGSDFTKQFNYDSISGSSNNLVVLYNNGVYVGYYWRAKYYNPDSTQISKPNYNEWALSASDGTVNSYHLYSVAYQPDITALQTVVTGLQTEITTLDERTQELITEFEWELGFYQYANGVIKDTGSGANYHHSNKVSSSQFEFGNPSVFEASNYNFVSFWNNDTYAGYYLNGKYYNPSQTEVESITYDEWSVNMYSTGYADLKPKSIQSRITALENQHADSRYDHLYGKKIGFLGDSITNGVGCSDYNSGKTKSYVGLMVNEFGEGNVIEYGENGSLIASKANKTGDPDYDPKSMATRYTNMSDNLDIVVVYGGTNDWYYGAEWGTTDSTNTDTFLGALNVLMSGLVEKYCGKEIFFVTPMSSAYSGDNTDNPNPNTGKTMLDYRNAIIERAAYHAIPVIDLYSMCGMDVAHNAANKAYYSSDGVHPNDAGYKRVHDRIVTFISNILY